LTAQDASVVMRVYQETFVFSVFLHQICLWHVKCKGVLDDLLANGLHQKKLACCRFVFVSLPTNLSKGE
jgi:hypothetical protein